MINLFKIDQNKFANILKRNLKIAEEYKTLDRLQSDLNFKLSSAKNDEEKTEIIKKFLNDRVVRQSLALIIVTDPSLEFSESAKEKAYYQILGGDEKQLNNFVATNLEYIQSGSSLKKILISLLSSKQKFDDKPSGEIPEINPEKGEGGVVYQPELTKSVDEESSTYRIGEGLLNKLIEYNIDVPDDEKDILEKEAEDAEFWETFLRNYKKFAEKLRSSELARTIDNFIKSLEKINFDNIQEAKDFREKFLKILGFEPKKQKKLSEEERAKLWQEKKQMPSGSKPTLVSYGKNLQAVAEKLATPLSELDAFSKKISEFLTSQPYKKLTLLKLTRFWKGKFNPEVIEGVKEFVEQSDLKLDYIVESFLKIALQALTLTEGSKYMRQQLGGTSAKQNKDEGRKRGAEPITTDFLFHIDAKIKEIEEQTGEFIEKRNEVVAALKIIHKNLENIFKPDEENILKSDEGRLLYKENIGLHPLDTLFYPFIYQKLKDLSLDQLNALKTESIVSEFLNEMQWNEMQGNEMQGNEMQGKFPLDYRPGYPKNKSKKPATREDLEKMVEEAIKEEKQEKQKNAPPGNNQQKESSLEILITKYASKYNSSRK
jgi:hypothetical protein